MAKKHRGRNEGSVFQMSNRKWRAQISIRGHRISKVLVTKTEALEWIRSMQSEIDKGFDYQGSNLLVKDYLVGWLENHSLSLRPKTAHQYRAVIRNHILPILGDKKIRDLRLLQIEGYYTTLLQKELGLRTVRVIHYILHAALD